jgi:hypothetical protein
MYFLCCFIILFIAYSNYERQLSIDEGVVSVNYTEDDGDLTSTYFVSYPDNVMVFSFIFILFLFLFCVLILLLYSFENI